MPPRTRFFGADAVNMELESRAQTDRSESTAVAIVIAVTPLLIVKVQGGLLARLRRLCMIADISDRLVVTVPEAARMLGISRAKLYPLISRGEIPSLKIGKCRRVPVREIESFIERQCEP